MHFGILGPLDVVADDGRPAELASYKLRSLLAMLVIDANRVVSLDRIIDQLWGDEPPATATGTLQAYVSQLRRLLEPGRRPRQAARVLITRAPGYALRAGDEEIDALCFDRLVDEAEKLLAGGRAAQAEVMVAEALALWRGDPLADVAGEPSAQPEIARLVERKVQAEEHRVDAWLAQGRHGVAVTELERLVGEPRCGSGSGGSGWSPCTAASARPTPCGPTSAVERSSATSSVSNRAQSCGAWSRPSSSKTPPRAGGAAGPPPAGGHARHRCRRSHASGDGDPGRQCASGIAPRPGRRSPRRRRAPGESGAATSPTDRAGDPGGRGPGGCGPRRR